MAQTIDKIIKSPYPPKSGKVLWLDKNVLKAVVNGEWESLNTKKNNDSSDDFKYFYISTIAHNTRFLSSSSIIKTLDLGIIKSPQPLSSLLNFYPTDKILDVLEGAIDTVSDITILRSCCNLETINILSPNNKDVFRLMYSADTNPYLKYVCICIKDGSYTVDKTLSHAFNNFQNLEYVELFGSTNVIGYVTDMFYSFENTPKLKRFIISSAVQFRDANIEGAFQNSGIEIIDWSTWVDGTIVNAKNCFANSSIKSLNLGLVDFSSADLTNMFYNCKELLYFGGINTSKGFDISYSPKLDPYSTMAMIFGLPYISDTQIISFNTALLENYKLLGITQDDIDQLLSYASEAGWSIVFTSH